MSMVQLMRSARIPLALNAEGVQVAIVTDTAVRRNLGSGGTE